MQSDRPISHYVMGAWLQFIYVSKRIFSSNVLLLRVFFSLDFLILSFTDREADDEKMERKGS